MEEVMEVEVEEVMEVAVAVAIQTSTSMAEDLLTPLEVRGETTITISMDDGKQDGDFLLHDILYFLYYYSTMNKTISSVRPLGRNIISLLPLYYVFVVMKISIINVFVSSSYHLHHNSNCGVSIIFITRSSR